VRYNTGSSIPLHDQAVEYVFMWLLRFRKLLENILADLVDLAQCHLLEVSLAQQGLIDTILDKF
jgi:hypothetical protein